MRQAIVVVLLALSSCAFAAESKDKSNATVTPSHATTLPLPSKLYHIVEPVWQIGNVSNQKVAHSYCSLNETSGVAECVIFDGSTEGSKMIGGEFVVTKQIFSELPIDERRLWHTHTYAVKNGLALLPDESEAVEKQALEILASSYGKTFLMPFNGMGSLERLSEKIGANTSNTTASGTAGAAHSQHSSRMQTLQAKAHNASVKGKEKSKEKGTFKFDANAFPFAIPQAFTTFTEKGPKIEDKIIDELNKIGKVKVNDRKTKFANLTTAEKVEGADFWETGRGIQLDAIALQLRDGNAEGTVKASNRTHPHPHPRHGGAVSTGENKEETKPAEEKEESAESE